MGVSIYLFLVEARDILYLMDEQLERQKLFHMLKRIVGVVFGVVFGLWALIMVLMLVSSYIR